MRMASSIPGELIPSASVWHAPGITPCVKTRELAGVVENYSAHLLGHGFYTLERPRWSICRHAERFPIISLATIWGKAFYRHSASTRFHTDCGETGRRVSIMG
jgi:hypothetical protein